MSAIDTVLNIAAGEIGYSRWNDNLPGTRYGRWYEENVDRTSGNYDFGASGVPFCAMFVSWVLNQAGVSCAGFPGAYCPDIHKRQNVSKYDLQRGDVVLFDWNLDNTDDHVGLVEYVDGAGVHTIEGNVDNGKVLRRTRSLSTICGGVRPNYSGASQPTQQTTHTQSAVALPKATVTLPLLKYGAGLNDPIQAVRTLQTLLVSKGYSLDIDGEFGSETERMVKNFQTVHDLDIDGEVGSFTWAELITK